MNRLSGEFEIKEANWRIHLWAVWFVFRNAVAGWTYFTMSFILDIGWMITNIGIMYYLASFSAAGMAPHLASYGGDFASYIILGVIMTAYLEGAMRSPYTALINAYWSGSFEHYAISPVGISALLAGSTLFEYFHGTLRAVTYLTIGVALFHIEISSSANFGVAVLAVLLGTIPASGLGLIAASTFNLLNARGGRNPVTWIVDLFTALTSGAYFPITVLPKWAQTIGLCLPHTYTYEAARLAILSGASLTHPVIVHDLLMTTLFACILLPIGVFLFKKGLVKGEKDGTLSRWT